MSLDSHWFKNGQPSKLKVHKRNPSYYGLPYLDEFFFQAEDGIRDCLLSRGLGDVYKRQQGVQGRGRTFTFRHAHWKKTILHLKMAMCGLI